VYENPSVSNSNDPAQLLDGASNDASPTVVEDLYSQITTWFNEVSGNELIVYMGLFVLLVFFLMWNQDTIRSLFSRRRGRYGHSFDRNQQEARRFPTVAMAQAQSYADSDLDTEPTTQSRAPWEGGFSGIPGPPDAEVGSMTTDSNVGIAVKTDEAPSNDAGEPTAEEQESESGALQPKSPAFRREENHLAALDASKKRLVTAELYTSELKARVTESQNRIAELENQLAISQGRPVQSHDVDQLVADSTDASHGNVAVLEAELADTKKELDTAIANANELEQTLEEANEELRSLKDTETQIAAENAELKLGLEKMTAGSSQASEEVELLNQQLLDKLESATSDHAQVKHELEEANKSIVDLQSRIDSQEAALEEARLENSEHLKIVADHETTLEKLKLTHDEQITTLQSDFDTTSGELRTQTSDLQAALDVAQVEVNQLREEAAGTIELFETFKANENLSLKHLEQLEQRLADSTVAIENEQAIRADFELSAKRLEQDLDTQTAESSQLIADLLKAEKAVNENKAISEQREAELQGERDRLEQELSNQAEVSSKLEADLLKAEEAVSASKETEQQHEKKLQAELERFEKELSTQAQEHSQLEADLLKAEEAVNASKASMEKRESELQAEVKRLEQELETQATASAKLEADLLKADEALSVSKETEQQHGKKLQAELERLEEELSTRAAACSRLEADLLKAEEAVSVSKSNNDLRETELQAEVKRLEQELDTQAEASSKLEADLLKADEALSTSKATEQQHEKELQAELERHEKELRSLATAHSQLEADLLKARK